MLEKSRKAFIWHNLRESRRLSASENECLAEIRRTGSELHVLLQSGFLYQGWPNIAVDFYIIN